MKKPKHQAKAKEEPKLANRRQNKHSNIKSGRTIAERREHLETANERHAAREKAKKRQYLRVLSTIVGFAILIGIGIYLINDFLKQQREVDENNPQPTEISQKTSPMIEIIDENTGSSITTRMTEYITKIESDFRELGYTPTKAVIPVGSIREVDFYLDGNNGYIKTTIDRGAGVTVEDADRMLRYLASINTPEFTYIDVRIDGKAYWK